MSRSFVLLLVSCAPLLPRPQGFPYPPPDSGIPIVVFETADTGRPQETGDTAIAETSCTYTDPEPNITDRYSGVLPQVHTMGCVHADGSLDALQYVGWVPPTGEPEFACANRLVGYRTPSCTYPMRWEISVYAANCPGWDITSVDPAPFMCVTPDAVSTSSNGFSWEDLPLTSYIPYSDGSFYFYLRVE